MTPKVVASRDSDLSEELTEELILIMKILKMKLVQCTAA